MKRTNKGITLAELLVAVAILSVVMLGIVSIMRTSSVVYKNSLFNVEIQEDAQLVANQLEELMCDATSISQNVPTVGAEKEYIVEKSEGTTTQRYTFVYDPTTRCIMAKKDYGEYSVLCTNVDAFGIEGWKEGNDNKATIKISLSNNGYNDTVARDIFFRNEVEDSSFHNISAMTPVSVGPVTPGTTGPSLEVKRYAKYSLTGLFGLCYDVNYVGDASLYYEIINDGANPLTADSSDNMYSLVAKDGVNIDFNMAKSVFANCKIGGYDKPSSDSTRKYIEVSVFTVPVSFVGMDSDWQGYYIDHEKFTANSGYVTYVPIDGIDTKSAIERGVVIKYDVQLKKSSGSDLSQKLSDNVVSVNNNKTPGDKWLNFSGGRIGLGMFGDPNDGALMLVTANDIGVANNLTGNSSYPNSYLDVKVKFFKPGGSTSLGSYNIKFKYRMPSNKLEN